MIGKLRPEPPFFGGLKAMGTTMVSCVSNEGLPNKTHSSEVSHFYVLFFVFYVTVITFAVIRVISAAARRRWAHVDGLGPINGKSCGVWWGGTNKTRDITLRWVDESKNLEIWVTINTPAEEFYTNRSLDYFVAILWCISPGRCKKTEGRAQDILVGGLEHFLFFHMLGIFGNNNPNWLSYFSEGLEPPVY